MQQGRASRRKKQRVLWAQITGVSPPQAVVRPSWAGKLQAETWHGRGQGRRKRLYEYSGGPPPVQRKAQSYREGSEFEISWWVHKMGFLVAVECGRAVSHRSKLIEVLWGFDNVSVIVKCLTGTAGRKNDAMSMLTYLLHLGFPLKAFYRVSISFLRLYIITQIWLQQH